MSTTKRRESLSDTLRRYIKADKRSMYALAEESGVPRGTLSRFVRGERELTLRTADHVFAALGLRVVKGK